MTNRIKFELSAMLLLRHLFLNSLFFVLTGSLSLQASAKTTSIVPVNLACELRVNPLGVDVKNPGFSFTLNSAGKNSRSVHQTAYQIVVSSSSDFKNENDALWNSGKVLSDKMAYLFYAGKALQSNQKYWWKMRVWDQQGNVSNWSQTANFTMGILNLNDWQAKWITAAGAEKFALTPLGYKAVETTNDNAVKWVQVDLGSVMPVSQINLVPMFYADRAGWGFPLRFKVEVADDAEFKLAKILADYSAQDFQNPHWLPVHLKANFSGRFVRVTASKCYKNGRRNVFALRQIEVISNGKNAAAGKKVEAFDSDESNGWTKNNLTDGVSDKAELPNYSSMLLRKTFEAKPKLVRAVIQVSGLSQYELTINGKKIGDYLFTPGWTNYQKTVLYDTYDVTASIKNGANAIGILLGNGMYNIQPDTIRYVKFLNSFGPAKAVAQLKLEYADGSSQTVITDKSWQVAPGPITYSNIFGGEDEDANLQPASWNTPQFTANANWKPALETTGPGGILKGLSSAAPPVKAIETLKPAKVTQIKDGLYIYDFGQNASIMPMLKVSGTKGAAVRMIPAELLGKNGLVDRASATQDGVRPAWWQYTLAGNGRENYSPKFFYQGARYLQVELFPAMAGGELPKIEVLNDVVVHSSSTPIGSFSCSNELFNATYKLIRWAQRSNMMSLMTDCPHREKLGWLEEDHLNGPSLRYNFDMAPLFRKTMNDMADAQLENGFIPNIAPEYFIAGPADLSNGFRNSPEWGSSFIIVPWQQYLFSGDVSLLGRYYDQMKRYVSFLLSSAKNNIIKTGLGDWYDIGPKEPWGSQLTPVSFTATAIYYYDNWIMSRIAQVLNKKQDASNFKNASEEIRASFNHEFFKPETVQYATGSQTCNAMPLFLNLVEPKYRPQLANALVEDIRKHGNSLTSGDVGYRFLLRALAGEGKSEVIYAMNNQSEKPGYGYQLKMGATSLTEKWDASVGSFGSQNHFMLGQINEWFYNDLGGISADENGAGFKKVIINPSILNDLTWVKTSYQSISGLIKSEWKKTGKQLTMDITIPANTTATVYIFAKNQGQIFEGKRSIAHNADIKFLKTENGKLLYQIGSGTYHFTSNLD